MTNILPKVNENGRYELKETSEALAVTRSTILRWTHKGLLKAGVKKSNNRRFWTGAEILRFWKSSL